MTGTLPDIAPDFRALLERHADRLDLEQIDRALRFSASAHRGQKRVSGEDFIQHSIAVARTLVEQQLDTTSIVAALLHDVVEDCEVTEAEIALEFGEEVARLVMEVTDDKDLPRARRRQAQVEGAPRLSPRACLIRIADKLHNVRSLHDGTPEGWDADRIVGYVGWARTVVDLLRGTSAELEALFDEAVADLAAS